jgi:excisionase family DNA binding protein
MPQRNRRQPTPPEPGRPILRVQHVAWLLGCSISKVEQLVRIGLIPSFKLDNLRGFHRDDIERYIEGLKQH